MVGFLDQIKNIWNKNEEIKNEYDAPNPLNNTVYLHKNGIGSTGTQNYAGIASEEYLQALTGKERAEKFDEMRRSSTQCKMLLSSISNSIRAGKPIIKPGDTSLEAIKHADLINFILFQSMNTKWTKLFNEGMSILWAGHSVFETSHKVIMNHPQFGNFVSIKKIDWRSPKTIYRWNLNHEGDLDSIDQYAFGDLHRTVRIPAKYLTVMTIDLEGSNFEGISLLRPCYGAFFRQNNYMKLNAIGIEKFSTGVPVAKVPAGKVGSQEYENLIETLEGFTTHQQNYLTYPDGWDIDIKFNDYDPSKIEQSIDSEDVRMAKAFLANFLELGMKSSGGSYSLSNDLSDFFMNGIVYIKDIFCEGINEVIKQIVDINFGPQAVYPKLDILNISDKVGKEFSEIIKNLKESGLITPDEDMENHIRNLYSLPDKKKTTPGVTLSEKVKRILENESKGKID